MKNGINVARAARLIGRSAVTLRRWDHTGVFSARRDPTGDRVYTPADLVELREIAATRRAGRPRKNQEAPA
ncbi:MAG: MerR family transcriptional regulator [Gammaproteobacteria bacterium]|nr:MerR family transcriptional regulator [Gammaproteobacteria bacterium]